MASAPEEGGSQSHMPQKGQDHSVHPIMSLVLSDKKVSVQGKAY